MLEIKGKVNTAICYAKVIEDEAINQIRRMCDYDMTAGSKIRIMPDVHAGKGCTIGTTMTIVDKAVPNVAKALNELAVGRTTLTVAHRLSTIRDSDRIFVLTENGIEEEGNHDELMAQKGIYYKFYQMAERLR